MNVLHSDPLEALEEEALFKSLLCKKLSPFLDYLWTLDGLVSCPSLCIQRRASARSGKLCRIE
ncbi:hypothetical protein TrispH2_012070 [Trichoplax sp. H2]|nr:hypothetical protein TrispH2_012070 [Trichoplax sp. H2]|eukprot:RDD36038.1 hypothetical protein TrispH2_012070 [Trichoplax sp. H2]